MPETAPRRITLNALFLLGLLLPQPPASVQGGPPATTDDGFGPGLAGLRQAAATWDARQGPPRQVVDLVCLVPDEATFYEALGAWDDRHFFPILIDDVDLTLKFLRAFRPARVVRYPGRGRPVRDDALWDRAVRAVGDAWSADADPTSPGPRGDARPMRLGPTPPGVVVASPRSDALPGLAALAAGRFQPLVRLDEGKGFADLLSEEEFPRFLERLEGAIRATVPDSGRLGDDCDFVTLAGDYPYRFTGRVRRDPKKPPDPTTLAVDDRIARSADGRRWAYVGRLLGDRRRSVYAAMCSLFLRPESALLFNGYAEQGSPWEMYNMRGANARLRSFTPTVLVSGENNATIGGWHRAFDPMTRQGLLLVNTSGNPTSFGLPGGGGSTFDIMPGVPSMVHIIHSYSAANPTDPQTIAGRWLAQGAFVYFGSMDEPFLQSFRPPTLIADLLAEGIPAAPAFRMTSGEPFGNPWKLVLLGDPLYRPNPRGLRSTRVAEFGPTAAWTTYTEGARPGPDASAIGRLGWAMNAAIVREAADGRVPLGREDILTSLKEIPRADVTPDYRSVLDELHLTLLYRGNRLDEVRAAARAIPAEERSAVIKRLGSSATIAEFQLALGRRDFDRALGPWSDLMHVEADRGFYTLMTARIAALAEATSRNEQWRGAVGRILPGLKSELPAEAVAEEWKRLGDRGRPKR